MNETNSGEEYNELNENFNREHLNFNLRTSM